VEHEFTPVIMQILKKDFKKQAEDIYKMSLLIQYLNLKTRSASRGAKARSSFGNIYAIYVLVEDYIKKNYHERGDYTKYDGTRFSELFQRQRELPFGTKLQNHHLNHRLNEEFHKYFPTCEFTPIMREVTTKRYWINENLLKLKLGDTVYNIAPTIIRIVDAYIAAKKDAFEQFLQDCEGILQIEKGDAKKVQEFIVGRLKPNVDARVFEIVSYAILKEFYGAQTLFWGWSLDAIKPEGLVLYKTGRTNANDGGIDFVMRPLGRFFQVTETIDARKYFLDIDKIQRFPLTFVVKSDESVETIRGKVETQARRVYSIDKIVKKYMDCIEDVINIPRLLECFSEVQKRKALAPVIHEIVLQSKVEFNYEEE
jgi:hypothetical protein